MITARILAWRRRNSSPIPARQLELVSPERFFAPEMGGLNLVPYMQNFVSKGVKITTMTRVRALKRQGNKIKAVFWSVYTEKDAGERIVDQVVVENATSPLADLYFDLKEESVNRGEVDYPALIAGRPQAIRTNPDGKFQLFRIGDAVASPQHPRRDLRRTAAVQGLLSPRSADGFDCHFCGQRVDNALAIGDSGKSPTHTLTCKVRKDLGTGL